MISVILFERYYSGKEHLSHDPQEFIQILTKFNPYSLQGRERQQEDSQEYLNWIIDRLHEELIRLYKHFGEDTSQLGTEGVEDDEIWEEVGKKE